MTNSQEYALHVLNELIVASVASAHSCRAAGTANSADPSLALHVTQRLDLAERLRAEVAALNGRAADSNSILAAAFAAMSANVSLDAETHHDRLQHRIDTALTDNRLSTTLRSGLAGVTGEVRRNQVTPM